MSAIECEEEDDDSNTLLVLSQSLLVTQSDYGSVQYPAPSSTNILPTSVPLSSWHDSQSSHLEVPVIGPVSSHLNISTNISETSSLTSSTSDPQDVSRSYSYHQNYKERQNSFNKFYSHHGDDVFSGSFNKPRLARSTKTQDVDNKDAFISSTWAISGPSTNKGSSEMGNESHTSYLQGKFYKKRPSSDALFGTKQSHHMTFSDANSCSSLAQKQFNVDVGLSNSLSLTEPLAYPVSNSNIRNSDRDRLPQPSVQNLMDKSAKSDFASFSEDYQDNLGQSQSTIKSTSKSSNFGLLSFKTTRKSAQAPEMNASSNSKQNETVDLKSDFNFPIYPRHEVTSSLPLTQERQIWEQSQLQSQNHFPTSRSSNISEKQQEDANLFNSGRYETDANRKPMSGFIVLSNEMETDKLKVTQGILETKASNAQIMPTGLESIIQTGANFDQANQPNFQQKMQDTSLGQASVQGSDQHQRRLWAQADDSNKWMGRSRAHRKMVRLLGTSEPLHKQVDTFAAKPVGDSIPESNRTISFDQRDFSSVNPNIHGDFQPLNSGSLKNPNNIARGFLAIGDELSLRDEPDVASDRIDETVDIASQKSVFQPGADGFPLNASIAATQNFMVPSFSTSSSMHGKETFTSVPGPRDMSNLPDFALASSVQRMSVLPSHGSTSLGHKDSSVSEFLSTTGGSHQVIDHQQTNHHHHHNSYLHHPIQDQQQHSQNNDYLDFGIHQRELELTDQFVMPDGVVDAGSQHMDLASFDPSQAELSLPDNLALESHAHPEMSLETYFNSKELALSRKPPTQVQAAPVEGDFNFDEYNFVTSQTQRDSHTSFMTVSDLPQDMTLYQKSMVGDIPSSASSKQMHRQQINNRSNEKQQAEISELQKELTKTSTKESVKGIKIPRDINRAMEILQSLQEDEREEERRKELEWKNKQLQQEEQQHQQVQLQNPPSQTQQQIQALNLNSSPKKTFQNKHYIESLNMGMQDQQLLVPSETFLDDQVVVGNFLDQSHLDVQEQGPDSFHIIQSFQNISQPEDEDIGKSTYNKRDANQRLTSELGYHILKRMALSTSPKTSHSHLSSVANQPSQSNANLVSIFGDGGGVETIPGAVQDFNGHYNSTVSADISGQLQRPDVFESEILHQRFPLELSHHAGGLRHNLDPSISNDLDKEKIDPGMTFIDFDTQQHHNHHVQQTLSGKSALLSVCDTSLLQPSTASPNHRDSDSMQASRKSMFDMMKTEQLCDAILSTSNLTVKVHQVVLCSVSNYLSTLLYKITNPSSSSFSFGINKTHQGSEHSLGTGINASSKGPSMFTSLSLSSQQFHSRHQNPQHFLHSQQYQQQQQQIQSPQSQQQQQSQDYQIHHSCVILVVNCDNIKASSLHAFLVFVYMGDPSLILTPGNVSDLYVLACCLRVSTLRDKCRDYMRQQHIPDDQLKVPELVVSSIDTGKSSKQSQMAKGERKETKDQACATESVKISHKTCEDKAVNTARVITQMEVATQTDRLTQEAGARVSHEDWVLLKKTKQKTVSPSKPRTAISGSGIVLAAVNGASSSYGKLVSDGTVGTQHFKLGKKGWLSPKRRDKSEVNHADLNKLNIRTPQIGTAASGNTGSTQEPSRVSPHQLCETTQRPVPATTLANLGGDSVSSEASLLNFSKVSSESAVRHTVSQVSNTCVVLSHTKSSHYINTNPTVKTARTTVELATEAAAAKLSGHSYGTRTARGAVKSTVSYASLASGSNKRKSPSLVPSTAISKKKAFIKSNPQPSSNSQDNASFSHEEKATESERSRKMGIGPDGVGLSNGSMLETRHNRITETSNTASKSDGNFGVKHPLKKNIAHRSKNVDKLGLEKSDRSSDMCSLLTNPQLLSGACDKEEKDRHTKDNTSDITDEGKKNRYLSGTDPLLPETKTFFQEKNSPTTTALAANNSLPPCPKPQSISPEPPPPQNFLKRLIQQLSSEQLTPSNSSQLTSQYTSNVESTAISTTMETSEGTELLENLSSPHCDTGTSNNGKSLSVTAETNLNVEEGNFTPKSCKQLQSVATSIAHHTAECDSASTYSVNTFQSSVSETFINTEGRAAHIPHNGGVDHNKLTNDKQAKDAQGEIEQVKKDNLLAALESEPDGREICGKQPLSQGIIASEDEHFTHKMFKRRKKAKPRKIHQQAGEIIAATVAKIKKSAAQDTDHSGSSKTRQRKSDSEPSERKVKVKKQSTSSNNIGETDSTECEGSVLPKFRAPPKKRAKMELALLKAVNLARRAAEEKKTDVVCSDGGNEGQETDHIGSANEIIEQSNHDGHSASSCNVDQSNQVKGISKTDKESTRHTHVKKVVSLSNPRPGGTASLKNFVSRKVKKEKFSSDHQMALITQLTLELKKRAEEHLIKSGEYQGTSIMGEGIGQGAQHKKLCNPKNAPQSTLNSKLGSVTLNGNNVVKGHTGKDDEDEIITITEKNTNTNNVTIDAGTMEKDEEISDDKANDDTEVKKVKLFSCKLCQIKHATARRVIKHLLIGHKIPHDKLLNEIQIGPFSSDYEACDLCGYETKDKSYHYMHYHKYFRHGIPLPPGWQCNTCKICDRHFATDFQLREHMQSHEQKSRFICWHCGQHFINRSNFNSHVFHKHSEVRKHQCLVCKKDFKTRTQLKVHLRIHTGERPFSCPDCGYGSTTRGNMKHHLKKHHYTKEKIDEMVDEIAKKSLASDAKSLEKIMDEMLTKIKNGEIPPPHQENSPKKKSPSKSLKKPRKEKSEKISKVNMKASKNKTSTETILTNSDTPGVLSFKPSADTTVTTSQQQLTGARPMSLTQLLTEPISNLRPNPPGIVGIKSVPVKGKVKKLQRKKNDSMKINQEIVVGIGDTHDNIDLNNKTSLPIKYIKELDEPEICPTSSTSQPMEEVPPETQLIPTPAADIDLNKSTETEVVKEHQEQQIITIIPEQQFIKEDQAQQTVYCEQPTQQTSVSGMEVQQLMIPNMGQCVQVVDPNTFVQQQQQHLLPLQLLLSSGTVKIQQQQQIEQHQQLLTQQALPNSSLPSLQVISNLDITSSMNNTDLSGQQLVQISNANAVDNTSLISASTTNNLLCSDDSQIIQIIASDNSLANTNGVMGLTSLANNTQIVQLMGGSDGTATSVSSLGAMDFQQQQLQHLISSSTPESTIVMPEVASSAALLPLLTPNMVVLPNFLDSGLSNLSGSTSATEQLVELDLQQQQLHTIAESTS